MSAVDPKSISILRLGEHGENKRVWIVNKTLQETFAAGEKVKVGYDKANKQIKITKPDSFLEGNHTISSRGNGTPVLDIKNKDVADTLGNVDRIEVLYFKDEIVIKVAKVEHFKNKRAEKTGLNTFELFCGGGTLTRFFRNAGFNIRGGLELNEEYLALFHENNPGEKIFSINGRIEDIHTSYFPKDIDVVLAGIPCTTFSGSNVRLKTALKNKREGLSYDEDEIRKADQGESLTFYVLMAIKAMNPRTVVIEEVVEYSESSASIMLRSILGHMGYSISEAVSTGLHTKRQRWCLVANMGETVNLDSLWYDDGKKIGNLLEVSTEAREWKHKDNFAPSRLNEAIGIRSVTPNDNMVNTFTTHGTRGTEPILQHPENPDLYSEFTNREIANIHGLDKDFVIDERKSIGRQIVGQGVTDMFKSIAKRIIYKSAIKGVIHEDTIDLLTKNGYKRATLNYTVNSTSSRYVVGGVHDYKYPCYFNPQTGHVDMVEICSDYYERENYGVLSSMDPTGSCYLYNFSLSCGELTYNLELYCCDDPIFVNMNKDAVA